MRQRAALVTLLLLFVVSAPGAQNAVDPQPIVAQVRQLLTDCDSQIVDVTFITTLHERDLKDDGSIESEKVYKSRHFQRDDKVREVLEAMWEDGKPVSASDLADEREKREKDRIKQEKKAAKGEGDDESQSAKMLEPLTAEHANDYRFPTVQSDSLAGVACWKITVEPVREDEDLVKGFIWVEQGSGRPLREEYDMAKRPGPVKDFGISMDHAQVLGACSIPKLFRMHAKGKALLVIKFNVDVELVLDSVQVNSGLPDSLFATP